ncbi:GerMN domain-containing protein [Oscillibacter sp.]|uniref:GerMN domain-containing protein n=1 Tax=Oscillibacter sp. TaxID=1945593 RepID=UPI00260924E4|nr:GerMN domain-containing protein [Oscillibacter sp.]MDD3346646.1 GerMN domain-containing protein [Oscillibacter sp.]
MKRIALLLLCTAMILGGGCAVVGRKQQENAYALYFQEANLTAADSGDALRSESILLGAQGADTQALAEKLMSALLEGPADETLKSPIPLGTQLLSVTVDRGRAVVDLTFPYAALSDVALTLADYAITLTLTQLPEILSVQITVRGQELAYRDKQVLTAQDVLLSPKGDVVSTVTATLYFLNEYGSLSAENRVLELYEGDTQVGAVARALESGPEEKNHTDALPGGFRVRSVWLEENTCYVNLSSALLETLSPEANLSAAMQALWRSLCSLDAVEEVRFLVDGEFARTYGTVNIANPYSK